MPDYDAVQTRRGRSAFDGIDTADKYVQGVRGHSFVKVIIRHPKMWRYIWYVSQISYITLQVAKPKLARDWHRSFVVAWDWK